MKLDIYEVSNIHQLGYEFFCCLFKNDYFSGPNQKWFIAYCIIMFIGNGSCQGQKEPVPFLQIHSGKSKKHTIPDWTSQIPLIVAFSLERHYNLTVLY